MCKEQYTIGVDYGSLSARGVLVRVRDGEIAAEAEFAYPHGIITGALPDGTPLPGDWFLEHPQDYLDAIELHCAPSAGAVRHSGSADRGAGH